MVYSIDYGFITFFQLKESDATSSSYKSMLLPSMYAVKMAIIDSYINTYGIDDFNYNNIFRYIANLKISFNIHKGTHFIVNKDISVITNFSKSGDLQKSISQREYVSIDKPISFIFKDRMPKTDNETHSKIFKALQNIMSFGNRDFMIERGTAKFIDEFNPNVKVVESYEDLGEGILRKFDDMVLSKQNTFDDSVNIYTFNPKQAKKSRVSKTVLLPLKEVSSLITHTHYVSI